MTSELPLDITNVVLRPFDDERVEITNKGKTSVAINGLEITDKTGTQTNPHLYRIPTAGPSLTLDPGEKFILYTKEGKNTWDSTKKAYVFYWGRAASVWNDGGDTVFLRTLKDGRFVDVSSYPKKH